MEVYTLGDSGLIENVIEGIESFIWTERYSAHGDFELVVADDDVNRAMFEHDGWIIQSDSTRVMRVDVIEKIVDEENKHLLKISGRSIESLMSDRTARSGATSSPYHWYTKKLPATMARNVFREICIEGDRSSYDIFHDIDVDETPRPNTIPEPTNEKQYDVPPQTVYKLVKEICDNYDLGFSITRNHTTGQLTYRVYTGYNRTSSQSVNNRVLFSVSLENLQSVTQLSATTDYCNVVWVYNKMGAMLVYPPGSSPSQFKDLTRRQHPVQAPDLTGSPTEAQNDAHLLATAYEYLANHRMIQVLEGKVAETSMYTYGVDYELGDLVQLFDSSGGSAIMMVTEQIFALDGEGLRTYPTLVSKSFMNTGTWKTWDTVSTWSALSPSPTAWGELP